MDTSLTDQLKSSYLNWLKQKLTLNDLDGDVIEITSPLMDRHNDHLQIYVIPKKNGQLKLTDDGYIVNDLFISGCDVNSTNKRKEILTTILNGFGVKKSENNELFVDATIDNFPQKKHMLLQAMLSVNDMFMTSKSTVSNIFFEEVDKFLFDNNIRASDSIKFTGKSGFDHRFDFVIPRSRKSPERILQTINNPTRERTEPLLFAWDDTKTTRRKGSTLYAVLNDIERSVNNDVLNALQQYSVKTILWSNRNDFIDELSA